MMISLVLWLTVHVCMCISDLLVFGWGSYLCVVSSSETAWVRGSRRSFLFPAPRACSSPACPSALGWSDSPRWAPRLPRSHSWSLWGSPPSSPPPPPSSSSSSPLLTPLSSLPFSPPPSPSSLPVIVRAEEGRVQLSLARKGKWQSHSPCCWLCWCQGVMAFQCWTELEWKKPEGEDILMNKCKNKTSLKGEKVNSYLIHWVRGFLCPQAVTCTCLTSADFIYSSLMNKKNFVCFNWLNGFLSGVHPSTRK